MSPLLRRFIGSTVGLAHVTVRHGIAKGARWTLFPWTSYWRGNHETHVQAAVANLGNGDIRGWSCWDLGAHFGIYSVALALRVGSGGQVAAFEPNPESFARLERHKRMNRLNWLKTYQAAASDRTGRAELFTYGDLGSTSTHLPYEGEAAGKSTRPIGISTVRLDDEVDSRSLRVPQFVKIDVEGHGHRAVKGMRHSIAKSLPTIIVAFHSAMEVDGVLGVLSPLGYKWQVVSLPASNPQSMIGGDYLFTPSGSPQRQQIA